MIFNKVGEELFWFNKPGSYRGSSSGFLIVQKFKKVWIEIFFENWIEYHICFCIKGNYTDGIGRPQFRNEHLDSLNRQLKSGLVASILKGPTHWSRDVQTDYSIQRNVISLSPISLTF